MAACDKCAFSKSNARYATVPHIHTKDDYLKSVKSKGLEPYREIPKPTKKAYTPSKWGKDILRAVSNNNGKASTIVCDEINKKLNNKADVSKLNPNKGGWTKD